MTGYGFGGLRNQTTGLQNPSPPAFKIHEGGPRKKSNRGPICRK
jgi:hypothetical protein